MACCAAVRICWDLMSDIHAGIGAAGDLKGVRMEVLRRDEVPGTARGRERSMLERGED